MKRMSSLLVLFCFLLSGCNVLGERIKEPVTFYYVRTGYQEDMSQIIDSEIRESSGHQGDLSYLLALYSMGPSNDDLQSPLPRGTRITPTEHSEEGIVLSLSGAATEMTDAEFTLAAACLGLTCMELISEENITILLEDRSITVNSENLMLYRNNQNQ